MFQSPQSARLGPLEAQLLELLWSRGNATVRELLDEPGVNVAYTTVMTTLDRLHKKGLLARTPEGRAFRYTPAVSRDEHNGNIVRLAIRNLFGTSTTRLPISYLVDAVSDHDAALLDQLEAEIEKKRKQLKSEGK